MDTVNDAPQSKIVLFLGGARSGKSALAEKIAANHREVAYVATAEAIDDEMRQRIEKHRSSRPSKWVTHEVNDNIHEVLPRACSESDAVIIDCLTVYVARRMEKTVDDEEIIEEVVASLREARKSGKAVYIVSNEVGLGLVPEYPVGRRYRDLIGIINQQVAELADAVLFTIAGIPVDLKLLEAKDY